MKVGNANDAADGATARETYRPFLGASGELHRSNGPMRRWQVFGLTSVWRPDGRYFYCSPLLSR